MSISFYNLKEQFEDQRHELLQTILHVSESGQYFNHPMVEKFESLVSHLYDGASCAGTSSGTAALTIALQLANLPKNSKVVIPALTYIATANAVVAAGLQPYCVDIDKYWLLNYDHLKHTLDTEQDISAVIAVDLYGQGVDLSLFKPLCDYYNVKLIVDAAQSFEIYYDHYHQIDFCDSVALSFNPLKNLGALANAGAVVSKNYTVDQMKAFTHQGKQNNDCSIPGNNFRIDATQAAVLLVKYERFTEAMNRKNVISYYYRSEFEKLAVMPYKIEYATPTNYVFPIAVKNPETVKTFLGLHNIQFASHYEKPVHHYSAYKTDVDRCEFASALAGKIISLPNHWHLSDNQVAQIVEVVKKAL
jgi:dTDP-4-amino-4,6-dideoxygalactose transaminase